MQEKRRRQISLATRNAFIYFVLFILGIGFSCYFILSYASQEISELTEKRLMHTSEMVHLKMEGFIESVSQDIDQLSRSPLLANYANDTSETNLVTLTEEYSSLLASKSRYFQIRLITSDARGKEIIRVERKSGEIVKTPNEKLQFKGERDYFKELYQLPVDSFYFSRIDLNREYGKISQPTIPTLRVGTKIKAGALSEFMLLVNVDLRLIFAELDQFLANSQELRLVNPEGHYLLHPDEEAVFTFEYGKKPHYSEEYPPAAFLTKGNSPIRYTEDGVNHISQLSIHDPNDPMELIISAKTEDVFVSFYAWRKKVLLITIGIVLIFVVIAFLYMRRQSAQLRRITNQLISFAQNPAPMQVLIDREDEIGQLAQGFESMSTQISQTQELIEKARDAAEKAYQEKNDFLENMSHEIRNPLQAILGTTEILQQNSLREDQRPYVEALRFNANQLKSLVTDILDYGKIRKGQVELQKGWYPLDQLAEEIINGLQYEARAKKITLTCEIDGAIREKRFEFDHVRLYQIVNNLLINALKFTPENGQVTLHISADEEDEVILSVRDTGTGISNEWIEKITNRHVTSNYTTGEGLGLSIVTELLRLYNSELQVKSVIGKGSTFTFSLHLASQKGVTTAQKQLTGIFEFTTAPYTILILEDDPQLVNWYRHQLKGAEIVVSTAYSEVPTGERFDLILSDLNLETASLSPDILTNQLIPLLTEQGKVCIVSGDERAKALFSEYPVLVKPLDKEVFRRLIGKFVAEKENGKPDFSAIIRDYDEDKKLIKNTLKLMITEWGKHQEILKESLLTADATQFEKVKHKAASSIRGLKLDGLEDELNSFSDLLNKGAEIPESRINRLTWLYDYYLMEMEAFSASLD